jgi:hypothetical protein
MALQATVPDAPHWLQLADVSDPDAPVLRGRIETARPAAVAAWNGFAYLADEDGGLSVYRISDPDAPRFEGAVRMPTFARGVRAEAGFVYAADVAFGLQVVDARAPAAPSLVPVPQTAGAWDVAVSAGAAYVGVFWTGIEVFDASDPLGAFPTGVRIPVYQTQSVALGDGFLAACGYAGLHVALLPFRDVP